jgi:hypothetical protein
MILAHGDAAAGAKVDGVAVLDLPTSGREIGIDLLAARCSGV